MRENEGKRGAKGANTAGKATREEHDARIRERKAEEGGRRTQRQRGEGGRGGRLYVQGTVTFPTLITVNH